jgi:hypothetical protein
MARGYPILCRPIISLLHSRGCTGQLTSNSPKKEVIKSLCSFGCNSDVGMTGGGGGILGG